MHSPSHWVSCGQTRPVTHGRALSERRLSAADLMSPQPEVLQASMGLYMATTTHPRSPLPRWFRELVAVQVSRLNDCFY